MFPPSVLARNYVRIGLRRRAGRDARRLMDDLRATLAQLGELLG